MKLYNYKRVETTTIWRKLHDGYFTEKQIDYINNVLDNYVIMQRVRNTQKKSGLFRLTLPFYCLTWVCTAFIFLPIKWAVTGDYYLKYEGKYMQFIERWGKSF